MEVHGLEAMVYVAYSLNGERRMPICGADGQSVQFRSRYAAQVALRDAGVTEATFVHRSAYGEMIGMDTAGQDTELRETIRLTPV
jgi:hypothetical protein